MKDRWIRLILQPNFKTTRRGMVRKLKVTSGLAGDFIYRHHVEPRVKLHGPKEETFPIPMKHIDFARTTYTSLDVSLEKQIEDYWNFDGEGELSDASTGFTRFILLNERPPDGYTWSGERFTRKQTTSRPDNVWPKMWKHAWCSETQSKAKRDYRQPKLDNSRQLRGKFFIEPNDEEFKLTVKAARRKMEVPMPTAVPCKIPIKSSVETIRNIGKRKTKYACIVDADESTRPRPEGAVHKPHQDHITAKGMNSMTHYRLVPKIIQLHQALKKRWQRWQWTRNGKNWRKFRHGSWRESEKKWSKKQKIRAEKIILRRWWSARHSRPHRDCGALNFRSPAMTSGCGLGSCSP